MSKEAAELKALDSIEVNNQEGGLPMRDWLAQSPYGVQKTRRLIVDAVRAGVWVTWNGFTENITGQKSWTPFYGPKDRVKGKK